MSDEIELIESERETDNVAEESKTSAFESINKVTPLSKYLAMVLFILMPFIGGWIGYNYAPENIVEVEKIVVKETNEVLTGEMSMEANFFTYRNDEYGFEFMYPKVLVPALDSADSRGVLNDDLVFKVKFVEEVTKEQREEMSETNNRPGNIFVRVFETDLPLEEWLLRNYKRQNTELDNYEIGWPIVLGGEKGFYSSTGCCGGTDIAHVVKRGDYIFELGTNSRYLPGEVVQSTADAFKFFEPVAISDWQTYRNEEYGFEFEYPYDVELHEDEGSLFLKSSFNHGEGLGIYIDIGSYDPNAIEKSEIISTWGIMDFEQDCNTQDTEFLLTCFSPILGSYGHVIEMYGDVSLFILGNCCKFKDLVSSLRTFEPQIVKNSYKNYRNEEYGFEFEYPSDEHLYIEDESTIESKWLYVEVLPEWDALNGSGVSVSLKKSSTEIFLNSLRQYGEVKNNGTEVVNGITWDKYQYVDPEPTHSTSTYIWLTEINGFLTQVSYWDYTNPTQLLSTFKIIDQ